MLVEKATEQTEVICFDSLQEFYDYCVGTPFNNAFRWAIHNSVSAAESFTKTKSFEEAVELFKNGWSDMASKLTQRLRVIENQIQPNMKSRSVLGVAGYQAVVPLYLNGIPQNMITRKNVVVKQRVVTINKSIGYIADVKADQIIEESIKALQIVKKLEAQGVRVNLNIILGTYVGYGRSKVEFIIKIRIKSSGEKLNVSKVAFPLVHPSMLRRLYFRFAEVYPNFTSGFVGGYGKPTTTPDLRAILPKDEYLLPSFVKKDMSKINTIDDLENV